MTVAVPWLMSQPGTPDPLEDLLELLRRPPWAAQAACRGMEVALFFPGKGKPTKAAKAVCGGCEAREPCLRAALADPETVGIWGGTTQQERRRLRAVKGPRSRP